MYRYKAEVVFNTDVKFDPVSNAKAGLLEELVGKALGACANIDVIVIDSISIMPMRDPRKAANDAAKAGVVIVSATQEKAQRLFDYEKERVRSDCE